MDITGKVALVTGGASGIGLAIVEEFLKHGLKGVIIADINTDLGEKVTNELRKKYSLQNVIFQKTNVTEKESFEDTLKTAINNFNQLDIIINNAGISNDIKYEKTININLLGAMHGTALAIQYMSKANSGNGGTVITIPSLAALEMIETLPVYSCTKVGVINLMRGFGHSFHCDVMGIRMIALLPGKTVQTNIISDFETFTNAKKAGEIIWARPEQKPSAVAKASVYLYKNGESGTCWVIEESKLYLLEFPEWKSYSQLINDNIDK